MRAARLRHTPKRILLAGKPAGGGGSDSFKNSREESTELNSSAGNLEEGEIGESQLVVVAHHSLQPLTSSLTGSYLESYLYLGVGGFSNEE